MSHLADLFRLPEPVLVTDDIGASADFLLYQVISAFKHSQARCIFISVSGDLARWRALCSKTGLSLDAKIKDGSFLFVDVSASMPRFATSLPSIFESTKSYVEASFSEATLKLVVLDSLSTLEWIGFSATEVTRFARGLTALCTKHNASLVFRHHVAVQDEPDDVFRTLYQLAAYHIEVRSLSSGRSGSVTGEIAVHPCPRLNTEPILNIPRKQALQYRLTDSGATYFQRGTGQVVL
ncbi:hypothetical protein K488DRAFT_53678 [Vararia minispora EC-137]|uniref:Uncharacterized protein n=1 Tax=Vararia minispora EC-137 TaxID=1314806 RepID=A0ACB8QFX4_9AGAM|nr:hypothetical protein K488DRAFT_53678 [Vararia minispora EC-137]